MPRCRGSRVLMPRPGCACCGVCVVEVDCDGGSALVGLMGEPKGSPARRLQPLLMYVCLWAVAFLYARWFERMSLHSGTDVVVVNAMDGALRRAHLARCD